MTALFWKLFILGWVVLVAAILANGLAALLGLKSWYDFISLLNEDGKRTFSLLSFMDYVWLFILYPLILGLTAYSVIRLIKVLD
jgi:hypothetical protein